jgi:hypothetical protein
VEAIASPFGAVPATADADMIASIMLRPVGPYWPTLEHAVACEEELGGSSNPKEGSMKTKAAMVYEQPSKRIEIEELDLDGPGPARS